MAFFGRRKNPSAATVGRQQSAEPAASSAYASAASLPEPTTDWTDIANVRAEWSGSNLTGESQGLLGWRNGTRMYHEDVIPAQRYNAAEYITRGLAHHLYTPILSDADAITASQHVLQLIDRVPDDPILTKFAPRVSRLALTVIRERGWQPSTLGGNDSVVDEILGARPDGLVVYSARCPGVPIQDVWRHFFARK